MSKTALGDLRDKARVIFQQMLDQGGATASQLILRVREEHPTAVEAAAPQLIDSGLGTLVSGIKKRPLAGHEADDQLPLPLPPGLEEKDVPETISVPTRANQQSDIEPVQWVRLRDATLEQFDAHIAFLAKGIVADTRRRNFLELIRAHVAPLMKADPEMSVEDALRKLRDDGKL